MDSIIDAYLPTVRSTWAELRVIARPGETVTARLAGHAEVILLKPSCQNTGRSFYRQCVYNGLCRGAVIQFGVNLSILSDNHYYLRHL